MTKGFLAGLGLFVLGSIVLVSVVLNQSAQLDDVAIPTPTPEPLMVAEEWAT